MENDDLVKSEVIEGDNIFKKESIPEDNMNQDGQEQTTLKEKDSDNIGITDDETVQGDVNEKDVSYDSLDNVNQISSECLDAARSDNSTKENLSIHNYSNENEQSSISESNLHTEVKNESNGEEDSISKNNPTTEEKNEIGACHDEQDIIHESDSHHTEVDSEINTPIDEQTKLDSSAEVESNITFNETEDLKEVDCNSGSTISSDPTSPSSFKARENIFDRVKNKSISESSAIEKADEAYEPVEQVKDYETSQPESVPVRSPMVVSVGTIEVNGDHEYEDINIMSKGSTTVTEKQPAETTTDSSDKNDDYESFKDFRFSSVSMYDKPHFEEDIEIIVEDAQKHAAESFVSYKVITKTTRESFQQHEFHVRRRYQDFLWLSNVLIQQYPSHIIPPMPQKKVFNRYDPDFLRLRQLALNKFLKRIAEHPILSTSEHFFTFLSAKQVELTEQKKSTSTKKFPNIQIPAKVSESPFKSTSEYLDHFNKILAQMSTYSLKLHKDQAEQVQIMKTLSPSAALWANVEGDLEPILSKLGDVEIANTELLEKLVERKEEIFNESIKEYQLYINLVKNVLKHRDQMHITRDYYTETVLSKQKDLEKLEAAEPGKSIATFFGKSKEQVKEDKINKLKQEITTLSTDGEAAADELVVANATIRSDIERWKINKEKDSRTLISSVADAHIQYFEQSSKNWDTLMHFIDNIESL